MDTMLRNEPDIEDVIVEELASFGIHYLSRRKSRGVSSFRTSDRLLADLILQPSSRVRTAIIPLLLEHPELGETAPLARARLASAAGISFELFYTAACFLQNKYKKHLLKTQGSRFMKLPDHYSEQLGFSPELSIKEKLTLLAFHHQQLTGTYVNWLGTYENAVRHWLHQKGKNKIGTSNN